jgi:hypothetical protein
LHRHTLPIFYRKTASQIGEKLLQSGIVAMICIALNIWVFYMVRVAGSLICNTSNLKMTKDRVFISQKKGFFPIFSINIKFILSSTYAFDHK